MKIKKLIALLLWKTFLVLLTFLENLQISLLYQENLVIIAFMFSTIMLPHKFGKKTISQTNIFNIFPSSVQKISVVKILQSNCIIQSKKYISIRSFCFMWDFTDLTNSREKHCITIDCSHKTKDGPGRYSQQTTLINRFAISINHMMICFIMFS